MKEPLKYQVRYLLARLCKPEVRFALVCFGWVKTVAFTGWRQEPQ